MNTIGGERKKPRSAPKRAARPRLIVATAGDDDSVGALRVAAELSRHRDATVLALGVATPFPHSAPSVMSFRPPAAIDESARLQMLEDVLDRAASVPGAERWTKRAVIGWPADAINMAASAMHASLIVLGLGRHNRLDRLFGTETAIAVIKRARVSVLAVIADVRGLPKRACAAVDFTPASLAAAAQATKLLAPDGTLTLVHACAFKGMVAEDGDLVSIYRAGAAAKLHEAVAELRRRTKRHVEGAVIDGSPAETILEYARNEGCDLIAIGGHKQTLMDRILLGSVRTHVIRDAPCSVLIAPPAG